MNPKKFNPIRLALMCAVVATSLTSLVAPVATPAAYMGWRAWLPTVTFYGERHCPECDSARKVLESVASENWRTIRVVNVNVRWHRRAAAHDGVTSTPTLIYRTHKRTEVARQQGEISRQEVESAVAKVIAADHAEKNAKRANPSA